MERDSKPRGGHRLALDPHRCADASRRASRRADGHVQPARRPLLVQPRGLSSAPRVREVHLVRRHLLVLLVQPAPVRRGRRCRDVDAPRRPDLERARLQPGSRPVEAQPRWVQRQGLDGRPVAPRQLQAVARARTPLAAPLASRGAAGSPGPRARVGRHARRLPDGRRREARSVAQRCASRGSRGRSRRCRALRPRRGRARERRRRASSQHRRSRAHHLRRGDRARPAVARPRAWLRSRRRGRSRSDRFEGRARRREQRLHGARRLELALAVLPHRSGDRRADLGSRKLDGRDRSVAGPLQRARGGHDVGRLPSAGARGREADRPAHGQRDHDRRRPCARRHVVRSRHEGGAGAAARGRRPSRDERTQRRVLRRRDARWSRHVDRERRRRRRCRRRVRRMARRHLRRRGLAPAGGPARKPQPRRAPSRFVRARRRSPRRGLATRGTSIGGEARSRRTRCDPTSGSSTVSRFTRAAKSRARLGTRHRASVGSISARRATRSSARSLRRPTYTPPMCPGR